METRSWSDGQEATRDGLPRAVGLVDAAVNIVDVLNQIWNPDPGGHVHLLTPDWSFVIALLPIIIVLGLVMPYLTGLAIGTGAYLVTKPRVKLAFEEGPRVAEIGPGGEPVFPVGLPHCRRDALVFESGTLRCERCHDDLASSV
jgi:hypothetical protein